MALHVMFMIKRGHLDMVLTFNMTKFKSEMPVKHVVRDGERGDDIKYFRISNL